MAEKMRTSSYGQKTRRWFSLFLEPQSLNQYLKQLKPYKNEKKPITICGIDNGQYC